MNKNGQRALLSHRRYRGLAHSAVRSRFRLHGVPWTGPRLSTQSTGSVESVQNGRQGNAFDTSLAKQDRKAARAAPTLARQTTPRVNMAAAPDCDQRAVRRLDYAYSQSRLFRTASLQGRPDRFSAAGLPGWTAFTCVSDSFTMSRSLLCQIWLLGWCLVRSVGCKVGLHPVPEPVKQYAGTRFGTVFPWCIFDTYLFGHVSARAPFFLDNKGCRACVRAWCP